MSMACCGSSPAHFVRMNNSWVCWLIRVQTHTQKKLQRLTWCDLFLQPFSIYHLNKGKYSERWRSKHVISKSFGATQVSKRRLAPFANLLAKGTLLRQNVSLDDFHRVVQKTSRVSWSNHSLAGLCKSLSLLWVETTTFQEQMGSRLAVRPLKKKKTQLAAHFEECIPLTPFMKLSKDWRGQRGRG